MARQSSGANENRHLRVAAFLVVAATALGLAAYLAVGVVRGHRSTILTIKYVAPKASPKTGSGDPDAGDAQLSVAGSEGNRSSAQSWFFHQRAYPNKFTPPGALARAVKQTIALQRVSLGGAVPPAPPTWTLLGPNPINAIGPDANLTSGTFTGAMPLTGRVSAVAPAPNNGGVFYIGGANGGVWKTTNGGASWSSVWPTTMASYSIGSIAVNPNNASDVWVGTGEANSSGDSYYGNGLYHSANGGSSWTRVDTANQFTGCFISSVNLVPSGTTTPTVNAAVLEFPGIQNPTCTTAKRGIWHVTNANTATPTLTHVQMPTSSPQCSNGTIAVPCQAPDNFSAVPSAPNTVYASGYLEGVWKSTNGGATWKQIVQANGFYRQVVSAYDASTVFLGLSDATGQGWGGLYKITNAGASNQALVNLSAAASSNSPCTYPNQGGGQCWYDLTVAADPNNTGFVFVGGIRLFRYTTGGLNSGTNIGYGGGTGNIHVDQHATIFDHSGNLWEGSDGGVYALPAASVTTGNHNFVNRNGTGTGALGITEFNFGLSGVFTNGGTTDMLIGGTQDNGTVKYTHATGLNWRMDHGGDGGATAWLSQTEYFAGFNGPGLYRTTTGGNCGSPSCSAYAQIFSSGDPAEFYPPLFQAPANPTTLYRGTDAIYRTTNVTATTPSWLRISPHFSPTGSTTPVTAIGASPTSTAPADIYVGLDATCNSSGCTANPKLEYTHNATAATPTWSTAGSGLPGRYITDFWVSPTTPTTAILTESGFNGGTAGTSGHVFKTTNGGATWVNISGNLPNVPVSAIAVDPSNPAKIFLGTDTGVFETTTGTASSPTWANINGTTLPTTAVVGLVLQNGFVIGVTHGRSAWFAPEP